MTLFHLWDLPGDVLAAPESASGLDRCNLSLSLSSARLAGIEVIYLYVYLSIQSFGIIASLIWSLFTSPLTRRLVLLCVDAYCIVFWDLPGDVLQHLLAGEVLHAVNMIEFLPLLV